MRGLEVGGAGGAPVSRVGYGRPDRQLHEWSELSPSLRALADNEEIHMVAFAYGYDLS